MKCTVGSLNLAMVRHHCLINGNQEWSKKNMYDVERQLNCQLLKSYSLKCIFLLEMRAQVFEIFGGRSFFKHFKFSAQYEFFVILIGCGRDVDFDVNIGNSYVFNIWPQHRSLMWALYVAYLSLIQALHKANKRLICVFANYTKMNIGKAIADG